MIFAAASAAVFIVLEIKARDLENDIATREGRSPVHNAASQLSSLPIIGGLFGAVVPIAEVVIDPQIATDKLELAAIRFSQGIVIIVGGAVVLYFLWRDVIQTPAQRSFELQQQAVITEAAVRGAVGGPPAAATPVVASVAAPSTVKVTPNPGRMRLYEVVHNEKRADEIAGALRNLPEHAFSEIEIKPRGKEWAVWVEEPD